MIRIGIVGCGRILNAHLHGFRQLRENTIDNFRITALVARREEDGWKFHTRGKGQEPRPPLLPPESMDPLAAPHTYLSDFQEDASVHVFSDYRAMIDARVVDAVLDTTPVYLHHQVGLHAIDAGLHLLTQKPLAITVRAARQMVRAARSRRVCLGVFENARYRPWVRAARWAFQSGLIGKPQMAVLGALGGLWSPDRVVADTSWRHHKLFAGGGSSIDIGVHQMDMLRYVIGEVQAVQAVVRMFEAVRSSPNLSGGARQPVACDVDDTYLALVRFAGDAIAQLLWSWAGHGAPLEFSAAPAFYGNRGCITGGQLVLDGGEQKPLVETFEAQADAATIDRAFPLGLRDPFAILQLDWLRGIEAGRDPETDGDEGLRDLAAAYAILESARAARAVTLEEVLSGTVDAYQRPIDEHYGLLG